MAEPLMPRTHVSSRGRSRVPFAGEGPGNHEPLAARPYRAIGSVLRLWEAVKPALRIRRSAFAAVPALNRRMILGRRALTARKRLETRTPVRDQRPCSHSSSASAATSTERAASCVLVSRVPIASWRRSVTLQQPPTVFGRAATFWKRTSDAHPGSAGWSQCAVGAGSREIRAVPGFRRAERTEEAAMVDMKLKSRRRRRAKGLGGSDQGRRTPR